MWSGVTSVLPTCAYVPPPNAYQPRLSRYEPSNSAPVLTYSPTFWNWSRPGSSLSGSASTMPFASQEKPDSRSDSPGVGLAHTTASKLRIVSAWRWSGAAKLTPSVKNASYALGLRKPSA